MAEATLSLTIDLLRQVVCDYHNWGTSAATPSAYYGGPSGASATEKALVDDEIIRGLRQFYNPQVLPGEARAHRWSFLNPSATLSIFPAFSEAITGQPSGTPDSTVTIADTTFLAAHVGQNMTFATSGNSYPIKTFTDTSNVVVDGDAEAEASDDTITIDNDDVILPDLFGALVGHITFDPEEGVPPIQVTGEAKIRELRQLNVTSARPEKAAVRPRSFVAATGQRWEMMFWPAPDQAYTLHYTYQVLQDNIATSGDYFPGGAQHGETIIQSVLSISEQRKEGFRQYHRERYLETLASSIAFDRQSGPQQLGFNTDRSDDRLIETRSELKNVTYNNVTY